MRRTTPLMSDKFKNDIEIQMLNIIKNDLPVKDNQEKNQKSFITKIEEIVRQKLFDNNNIDQFNKTLPLIKNDYPAIA